MSGLAVNSLYIGAGLLAGVLLVYLVYALLNAEDL